MAAEVGLALLTASLDVLFDRLASPELLRFIKGKRLDESLLERFKTTLNAVNAVLNDAEQKQIKDPAVKKWLDALKDAVYDADCLLDELSTRAATPEGGGNIFRFFTRHFNLKDRELESKMEEIIQRLDEISKHKDVLGLKNIVGEKLPQRSHSAPLVVESDVLGREKDKEAIIDFLLSDDTSNGKIGVIPIVGLGGIGKTTLAQLVYNDNDVKQKFNLRAWVCVSDDFDVLRIMRNIMEDISCEPCNKTNMNSLQLDLTERLKEKKFLIVLDDVWSERDSEWDALMTLFRHGSEGSKIIVTTRSETVASIVQPNQTIPFHRLGDLSDESCWLVFLKHASPCKDSITDSFLEEVRADIIRRCKGLPLAAKMLGGLLRSNSDAKNWEIILKSDMWESSELEKKVIPALRVSYHHLPPHLKRCFVYCSLFPKDFEFRKEELILLWMAEDLLQSKDRNMTLEEVGHEYFDELISKLFFQHLNNSTELFVMPDHIHDLAESFAGEFFCRFENDGGKNIGNKVRHMSYKNLGGPWELEISDLEFVKSTAKALRTFLHWTCYRPVIIKDESLIQELLLNCKCLRALSLCDFQPLEVLPDSIGELIHLRYLNLSGTGIRFLPDSLCQLRNLQTLILTYCSNLTRLPNDMQDLVNLRHLDVHRCGLEEMPKGMGNLKNLHYLNGFVVGEDKGSKIGELGGLSNLANDLWIRNLQNVRNKEEVSQARIMDKKYIKELTLQWNADDVDDSQTQKDILEELQPHKNLEMLSIRNYMGTKFSDWLGHHSYGNMTEIYLDNCKNCCSLPPLGQLPYLKTLTVWKFDKLVSIDAGFYENSGSSLLAFPSLEYLEFYGMYSWKKWCLFDKDAFPVLRELRLFHCPQIMGDLPKQIPFLKRLEIRYCDQLSLRIPRALLIDKLCIVRSEEVVLQTDQGPLSVKKLSIRECKRLEFPRQLCGESLESLKISDSCCSLISLSADTFPNLKRLRIDGCENLKSVSICQASLQNLTEVEIRNCLNLEEIQIEEFVPPNVTPWKVEDCPKLKPKGMVNLKNLHYLSRFVVGKDKGSKIGELGGLSNLANDLSIWNLQNVMNKDLIQEMSGEIARDKSLGEPNKWGHLEGFAKPDVELPVAVAAPKFIEKNLELPYFSVPESSDDDIGKDKQKLQDFRIEKEIYVFGSSFETMTVTDESQLKKLPSKLQSLRIVGCPLVESPNGELENKIASVSNLYAIDCPFLEYLVDEKNSTSWRTLYIHKCIKLKSLQSSENFADLEHLCIGSSCESLQDFTLNYFPKLKTLCIWDLPNLKSLSIPGNFENPNLQSLEIRDCPRLVSFPTNGLPTCYLKSLTISNCIALKSLPNHMDSLESLQTMFIDRCPELDSLPEGGLPSSLSLLSISFCDQLVPKKEWELNRLRSLTSFEIEGGCVEMKSFPDKDLLPNNLNSLRISKLSRLESLDYHGLQQLTALQSLDIDYCRILSCIPDEGLPSSLASLRINESPLVTQNLV